jgi:uncharacterized protein YndB with AHSA1/START domain
MRLDPVRTAVTVPGTPEDAFATFVDRFEAWWPREYTWSNGVLEGIGIEPRVGGLCWERGPYGMRYDWGRVLAWEPPQRLGFSWQIGFDRTPTPNPAHASEIEVRFVGSGPGGGDPTTRVELEHRAFERHGADAAAYRAAMASQPGWPSILRRFADAVEARRDAPWLGLTT